MHSTCPRNNTNSSDVPSTHMRLLHFWRKLQYVFLAAAIGLICWPQLLYGVGLSMVHGRPMRPKTSLSVPESRSVWLVMKEQGHMRLRKLSPFTAVALGATYIPLTVPGVKIAGFIAEDHLARTRCRKDKRVKPIMKTALTIWLTRNWKLDELLARAAQIIKERSVRPVAPPVQRDSCGC